MSPPRRRRRRGRGRGSSSGGSDQGAPQEQKRESAQRSAGPQGSGRKRRRRGRGGGRSRTSSPKSSEDLVRALPKERPETLTAPPDGQNLEELIGELQSTWGVPQYPQEFRITIRVAENRDRQRSENGGGRSQAPAAEETTEPTVASPDGPKREKAPSPHRLSQGGTERPANSGPKRKRKRRRRRGGGGGNNPGGQPGGTPPSSPSS